ALTPSAAHARASISSSRVAVPRFARSDGRRGARAPLRLDRRPRSRWSRAPARTVVGAQGGAPASRAAAGGAHARADLREAESPDTAVVRRRDDRAGWSLRVSLTAGGRPRPA